VRNSSLVKWSCADNVAGLKHTAEAVSFTLLCGWVGERRVAVEAAEESSRGGFTSENAGMSSESRVRNSAAG
jgi:hypothetical protein